MVRMLLTAMWFVVVPLMLALFVMRYLVPSPYLGSGPVASIVGRLGNELPVPFTVGLFLLFSALLRYWRSHLPGGRAMWVPFGGPSETLDAKIYARRTLRSTLTLALSMGAAVGLAWLMRTAVFESYRVQSSSMLPTLQPGDRVGVSRTAYGVRLLGLESASGARMPTRGDIVVFRNPENSEQEGPEHLVKRVVGLPGDRIGMIGGHPIINGWTVPSCDAGTYLYVAFGAMVHGRLMVEFIEDQAYLTVHTGIPTAFDDIYEVKPGEVFVLGDNRDNSSDSRAWNAGHGGGALRSDIVGKARWFLAGTKRTGRPDFAVLLHRIGRDLRLEGLDATGLEKGILRCLEQAPNETRPPAPQARPISAN